MEILNALRKVMDLPTQFLLSSTHK